MASGFRVAGWPESCPPPPSPPLALGLSPTLPLLTRTQPYPCPQRDSYPDSVLVIGRNYNLRSPPTCYPLLHYPATSLPCCLGTLACTPTHHSLPDTWYPYDTPT